MEEANIPFVINPATGQKLYHVPGQSVSFRGEDEDRVRGLVFQTPSQVIDYMTSNNITTPGVDTGTGGGTTTGDPVPVPPEPAPTTPPGALNYTPLTSIDGFIGTSTSNDPNSNESFKANFAPITGAMGVVTNPSAGEGQFALVDPGANTGVQGYQGVRSSSVYDQILRRLGQLYPGSAQNVVTNVNQLPQG